MLCAEKVETDVNRPDAKTAHAMFAAPKEGRVMLLVSLNPIDYGIHMRNWKRYFNVVIVMLSYK